MKSNAQSWDRATNWSAFGSRYDGFVLPEPKPISTVFLDTQVFVAASFNFNAAPFKSLLKYFESGRLRLLLTDVTIAEVKSNITEEVGKEIGHHAAFIKKARFLKSSSIAEVLAAVTPLNEDAIVQDLLTSFDQFTKAGRAMIADVASVEAGPIFEKYFAGAPPFSDAANKKSEFPDAFVLQALGQWAEDREEFVFVVSGDELFRNGSRKFTGLVPMTTLAELLDYLANEDEKRAEFVRAKIKDNLAKITAQATEAFEDNFYWVENEEGDATVEVDNLTLMDEPEILSIDADFATVQLMFKAEYTAHLDYRDSATSVPDKETGGYLYFEDREEEVNREAELTVQVEVSFDEDKPDELSIDSVAVVSPSGGFGIETSDANHWPYK